MKYPNFFIVGAARCGTTSLYNYLQQHPQVYMSPIKEPHFFSTDFKIEEMDPVYLKNKIIDFEKYFSYKPLKKLHITHITKEEYYYKLFEDVKNEKAIGEASTGYLYSKVAAKNIKEKIPHAKIIIILRDPIERAFSHYLMDLNAGLISGDFIEEVLKDYNRVPKGWGITHLYIDLGLYYKQVKRYLDIFPKENIKIIIFEEMKANFQKIFQEICKFLEIDIINLNVNKKYNVSRLPKYPKLNKILKRTYINNLVSKILPVTFKTYIKRFLYKKNIRPLSLEEKKFLIKYFYRDIKMLENLIQRDLSIWYDF